MATSGSFSTSKVKPAGGNTWWWDFYWYISNWSGNTATVNWSLTTRALSRKCSYI